MNDVQKLIDGLIACEEAPSEEQLKQVRHSLEQKVSSMSQKGRRFSSVMNVGGVVIGIGIYISLLGILYDPHMQWLMYTGFGILAFGYVLLFTGGIGRAQFLGWNQNRAKHDLHEAALMEIAFQVQRLTERLDALEQKLSPTAQQSN